MHPFVQKRRVDQPVHTEKVQLVPDGQRKTQGQQIPQIIAKADPWHIAIGENPKDADLIGRPNRNAKSKAPDQTVQRLLFEQKDIAFGVIGEFGIVFEMGALTALDEQAQLKDPVEHKDRGHVQGQYPQNPAPSEMLHRGKIGHQIMPKHHGRDHEQHVPRQKIAWQPFQNLDRVGRKGEERRDLQRSLWGPIAALVARAVLKVVHLRLLPIQRNDSLGFCVWLLARTAWGFPL